MRESSGLISDVENPRMNANEQVRLDRFFSQGGTVGQIERLAQAVDSSPISIDDLSLDWALDQAERQIDRCAAQYVRRDGCLVYAVPLADRLALVSSDGSVTLASNDGLAATRATLSPGDSPVPARRARRSRRRNHSGPRAPRYARAFQ
jgi:hypothetical protein